MLLDAQGKTIYDDVLAGRRIILYGASTRNQKAIDALGIQSQVIGIVDSDKQKEGDISCGFRVFHTSFLNGKEDCIVLSVLTLNVQNVLEAVAQYGNMPCYFYDDRRKWDTCQLSANNDKVFQNSHNIKYIHIFPLEKFIVPFYEMLESFGDISEHFFIIDIAMISDYADIIQFCRHKTEKFNNMVMLDDVDESRQFSITQKNYNQITQSKEIRNYCDNTEKIFLHSTFLGSGALTFVKELCKDYSDKMCWIAWGGDTYYSPQSFIVTQILQKLRCSYAYEARVGYTGDKYNIKVKPSRIQYTYIPAKQAVNADGGKIKVLVGHSAAEYGNQIYALRLLTCYRDKIEIYCPLSYGSPEYREKVTGEGRKLFGKDFHAMKDYMEMSEYYAFLNNMEVAVFPMTRHAAGTTLKYLSAIGKKIYISTELIGVFRPAGIECEDIEKIRTLSLEEFIKNDRPQPDIEETIRELNRETYRHWIELFEDDME